MRKLQTLMLLMLLCTMKYCFALKTFNRTRMVDEGLIKPKEEFTVEWNRFWFARVRAVFACDQNVDYYFFNKTEYHKFAKTAIATPIVSVSNVPPNQEVEISIGSGQKSFKRQYESNIYFVIYNRSRGFDVKYVGTISQLIFIENWLFLCCVATLGIFGGLCACLCIPIPVLAICFCCKYRESEGRGERLYLL